MKVWLKFSTKIINEPIISNTIRKFDFDFNIMKADISPKGGEMLVEIKGSEEDKVIKYLKSKCVDVSIAKDVVIKDDFNCIDCGACVSLCPSNAISVMDDKTVVLDNSKCLFCTFCITVCPTKCVKPMQ